MRRVVESRYAKQSGVKILAGDGDVSLCLGDRCLADPFSVHEASRTDV